ncbi:inactive serine/threonine-protein kinase PLK5 isoform 2-T2 [Morphnus guianensis]
MVARGCAGDELPGWFIEDAGSGMLYKRGRLLGEGTFGRCYQLTEVASGRVYAAKVIPRVRLTTVGIGERVSLGDTQKVPREVGVIPTHRDPPQSPALAPSPSFPGRWMGSHPHLPKGACRGSPDPEGSLGAGGCRARADAGGAGAGAARLPAPPAHRPPPRALRRQQPRLPAAGVLQPAGERAPAPQNGASPCQGFARPRSWHLAPSPVPRRHPAGPGEADGAGGAVLPAADHLGAEIPPRTGHRPPGPQAEQLLGDQEDAGEDRGSGAGTAGGTSWTALGGALRNAQLPGPGGVGPQGTRGALGRLGPGLRHGFTPDRLPPHACRSVPVFVGQDPLCRLLRGAATALVRGWPCRERRDLPPCHPGGQPSSPCKGEASSAGPEPCKHPLRKTFISARNRLKSSH